MRSPVLSRDSFGRSLKTFFFVCDVEISEDNNSYPEKNCDGVNYAAHSGLIQIIWSNKNIMEQIEWIFCSNSDRNSSRLLGTIWTSLRMRSMLQGCKEPHADNSNVKCCFVHLRDVVVVRRSLTAQTSRVMYGVNYWADSVSYSTNSLPS